MRGYERLQRANPLSKGRRETRGESQKRPRKPVVLPRPPLGARARSRRGAAVLVHPFGSRLLTYERSMAEARTARASLGKGAIGAGPAFGDAVTGSEHFCGLNFTGSVPTFKRLWKQVSENLDRYRNFPRLAGECGGKNFHLVHSSADVSSVVNGTLRSAFEYGGQKCSACSRLYAPDSLWPQIKEKLLEEHRKIKVGDPAQDFGTFFSAVIDDKSFARIKKWIEHAKTSSNLTILAGGGCDDAVGYFVEPCIVESKDPKDPIMREEIFGPVLAVYVYPEKRYEDVLELVDTTTPYGLTGAVFARQK
nr:PREDICTED: delta-1-pyrroline-5-carboxylate dehydrogenase, mitochondrial [Struthio camelus australis]